MFAKEAQTLAVDNFVHFFGLGGQIHAFQLDLAVTNIIIDTNIVVLDLDPKNHVVQIVGDVAKFE